MILFFSPFKIKIYAYIYIDLKMSKTKASPSKQLAENTSSQPTNEKKRKLESQEKSYK